MGNEMLILGIGGLVVIGGAVLFWDKICPAINACDWFTGMGGDAAAGTTDDGTAVTAGDPAAAAPVAYPGLGPSKFGCCECKMGGVSGKSPKCQKYGAGPWITYASALKEKTPEAKLARSLTICNKTCPARDRGNPKGTKKSNFAMGYDTFFAATNGRMSI